MRKSNYDKYPTITPPDAQLAKAFQGWEAIGGALKKSVADLSVSKVIITVDCYPGVIDDDVLPELVKKLQPALTVESSHAYLSEDEVYHMIERNLTDDRVRGVLSCHKMLEFFDENALTFLREQIDKVESGLVLIYGVGAALICKPDILIYADLARWEIQLRFRRKEISNWIASNAGEDFLRMYKRGFFIDWRVADRHKIELFDEIDFIMDTNDRSAAKMIDGNSYRDALKHAVTRPFRVVPYFDEGPWGGQWMKEVCDLDKSAPNFAWCFDCVPEENSIFLHFGDVRIETPSINLVFYQPRELLGDKVHARFGTEFPIRFDFLDTMEGGNLSLQVHPTTEYIQQNFGMHYTQDESYYLLDVGKDGCVYLGVKNEADAEELLSDLRRAQTGKIFFDAEKYINKWPAKKHDHFLIPGGTIHCSGANSMVLEISATPYIFTFKLWDWGRLGLDGKPRPIHIDHGEKVINWQWRTDTIRERHINCIEEIASGDGWVEERTGLHEREFIETRRHWMTKKTPHNTNDGVNVLNLVEGEEAIIESPTGAFEPFVVHYAETFIIPAAVGEYTISPHGKSEGEKIATIKAYVRT